MGLKFRVSGLVVFIVGLDVRVSVWGFRALNKGMYVKTYIGKIQ